MAEAEGLSLPQTMLASAGAGMVARIPCHPIDTCKSRIQVDSTKLMSGSSAYRGLVDTFRSTLRHEGVRGLYRGFPVAFWGSGPAACIYFTSYERTKAFLSRGRGTDGLGFARHFAAGMVAESISCVLFVPIDVVKERMQVQKRTAAAEGAAGTYYRSVPHALRTIAAREGISGIYKGYWATLLSFGPFSGLHFLFYEKLKGTAQRAVGSARPEDMPFLLSMTSGASAGAAASYLTTPLDLVKLRLQVQRGAAAAGEAQELSFRYRGVWDGLRSIVRNEGGRALFRGAGARVLFFAPATAVSMAAYEQLKVFVPRLVGRGAQ